MKSYPKIQYFNKGIFGESFYAFDKLDGSNLRFEYSRKRGWYKFGTRNVMIDKNSEFFGDSIDIFLNKYANDLEEIFRKEKQYRNAESFVVFGEYLGEHSFAGKHDSNDVKDVIIFDINQYKKGFIPSKQFIEDFGHLDIPKLIYQGEYDMDFINAVRNNVFDLKEGVVCKGVFKSKGLDQIWMTKIKTYEWLEKVKLMYGEKYLIEELNGDITLFN